MKKIVKIGILIFSLLVLFAAAEILFFSFSYQHRVTPGIFLGDKDISGMDESELEQYLQSLLDEIRGRKIYLTSEDPSMYFLKERKIDLLDGLLVDAGSNARRIIAYKKFSFDGKKPFSENVGDFMKAFFAQMQLLFRPEKVSIHYVYDFQRMKEIIEKGISLDTSKKRAQDGCFLKEDVSGVLKNYSDGDIVVSMLCLSCVKDELEKIFSSLSYQESVNISYVDTVISSQKIKEDLQAGKIYFQEGVELKFGDEIFMISREEFLKNHFFRPRFTNNLSIDGFDFGISYEYLESFLLNIEPDINQDVENARFQMQDGRVTAFAKAKEGRKLLIPETIEEIDQALSYGRKTVFLVVERTKAEITETSAKNFDIKDLFAVGESNFTGSTASRIHNITVGASRFDGVIIKPSEEFSFNRLLGPVDGAHGFYKELVILKNKTTPEYGGGLCQVSTTMFRAALNAGFDITERKNHSYPVRYYYPTGTDATIYPPARDLKFVNNSGKNILIQAKVDREKKELSFEFYGTKDDRNVEVDGPYQFDRKPDGSLKTRLTQRVFKKGELILEKTFYSKYDSPNKYPKVYQ